jgi:hypothetical protein
MSGKLEEQQPKSTSSYVAFDEFDPEKVIFSAPHPPKTSPNGATNQKQIDVTYNYGTVENPDVKILKFEAPELTTTWGINEQVSKFGDGKIQYSIACTMDMNNPKHVAYIDFLDNILYSTVAKHLGTVKMQIGMKHFDPANPKPNELSTFVYYPRDKVSGDILEEKPPAVYHSIYRRVSKANGNVYNTIFIGLDHKEVSWDVLKGVNMNFIPLMQVNRIFIGTKASIQIEMQSAVITSVQARDGGVKQDATIDRLIKQDPDLAKRVSSQLATLNARKQAAPTQTVSSDTSTFAGIGSKPKAEEKPKTVGAPQPSMAQIDPTTQSSSSTNPISEFIAAAPKRSLRTQPALKLN